MTAGQFRLMDVVHHVIEQLLGSSLIGSSRDHGGVGVDDVADPGEAVLPRLAIGFLRRYAGDRTDQVVSQHADIDFLGHHVWGGRVELVQP